MSYKVSLKERFQAFRDDRRAKKDGKVRIAPVGTRGRIYALKEEVEAKEAEAAVEQEPVVEEAPSGDHRVGAKATATLHMKITRADGSVEYRSVPAEVEEL